MLRSRENKGRRVTTTEDAQTESACLEKRGRHNKTLLYGRLENMKE